VDRHGFSAAVTQALATSPLITISRGEITALPSFADMDSVIIATGPLTSGALAESIRGGDRREFSGVLRRHCAHCAS